MRVVPGFVLQLARVLLEPDAPPLAAIVLEEGAHAEDCVGKVGKYVPGADSLERFEGAQVIEVDKFVEGVGFQDVADERHRMIRREE